MDSNSTARKSKKSHRKRRCNKNVNNNVTKNPKDELKPDDAKTVTSQSSLSRPRRNIVKAKEKIDTSNKKSPHKKDIGNSESSNASKGSKLQPRNSKISFSVASNKMPSSTNVLNVYQKEVLKKRQERLGKTDSSAKSPNIAENRMKLLKKRLSDEILDETNPNKMETGQNRIEKVNNSSKIFPIKAENRLKFAKKRLPDKREYETNLSKMETAQDDSDDKFPPLKRPRSQKDSPYQNMEVDVILDEINQARFSDDYKINNTVESIGHRPSSFSESQRFDVDLTIVVDTNILLSHISMVDEIANYHSLTLKIEVMIPWRVLGELDSLKNNRKMVDNVELGHLARKAVSYFRENLTENPRLRAQSLKDAFNHLYPCLIPDDEILNCCLQINNSNNNVLLLSNDKNLCNKASANNIDSCSHSTIRSYLTSRDSAKVEILNPSKSLINTSVGESSAKKEPKIASADVKLSNAGIILQKFLSVVLEEEMKIHYEELWERIILHKPPWSIQDIFECILRHWIAVFSDVFSRNAIETAKELKFYFPRRRSNKQLTDSDMKLFISSCVRFLQPLKSKSKREYSKLVEDCCISLKRLNEIETPASCTHKSEPDDEKWEPVEKDDKSDYVMDCTETNVDQIFSLNNSTSNYSFVEIEIFDMFQFIWRSFNNYCSLLANSLGVDHCFEDKFSKSSLDLLITQVESVGNQVNLLIENMSRTLMSNSVDENSPEYMKCEANKAIDSFYQVLLNTVQGMNRNKPNFNNVQLFNFSTKHRKLLEDGFEKFTMLRDLLLRCGEKYAILSNQNCNIFS